MSARFRVIVKGFRNERGQFSKLGYNILEGTGDVFETVVGPRIKQWASDKSPEDSGELAAGWAFNVNTQGTRVVVDLTNDVGYLEAVIKGRKPGPIPKNGGEANMKFEWNGETVFAKRVWHPGTNPNNFMEGFDSQTVDIAAPGLKSMILMQAIQTLR